MEVAVNHLQRLEIRLTGRAFVGYRARDGWRQPLQFYAFRCPVHGYVEDYPHGYAGRLECPLCSPGDPSGPLVTDGGAMVDGLEAVPVRA